MWKSRWFGKRAAGIALTLAVLWVGAIIPQGWAQDLTVPAQVVDEYIASLVSGDTERLNSLIDGPMKAKNSHLVDNADSYSSFLKKHYSGVQTSVEEIIPDGAQVRARVRFDFPTHNSTPIELILTEVGGQWKITDEIY
jgi:predicted ester cyclase